MTLVAVPPEIESEPPPPIAIAGPEPSVIVSSLPSAGVVEKTLSTSSGLPSGVQAAAAGAPAGVAVERPVDAAAVAEDDRRAGAERDHVARGAAEDDVVRGAGRDRVDAANRVVGREDAAGRERQAAEADGACGGVELAAVAEDH